MRGVCAGACMCVCFGKGLPLTVRRHRGVLLGLDGVECISLTRCLIRGEEEDIPSVIKKKTKAQFKL